MPQRTALVTGAARGIGAAIGAALRAQDVRVLDAGRAELNLSDSASITSWLGRHGGGVDILVNNAGINVLNDIEAITPEDWAAMVQVDLTAPLQLIQGVSPGMRARGWGRIVNISSVNGQKGQFGQVNYSTAKAGLHGFTMALAQEVAAKGVTVNTVSPGYIGTDMVKAIRPDVLEKIVAGVPAKRLGQPEEIASIIAWIASDEGGYATGADFSLNGGLHMG